MRIAWTGPVAQTGGVPGMGRLILRELLRQGVEVDLYTPSYQSEPAPIEPMPGLRVIEHRSGWRWNRWYSSTRGAAFFSGTASRIVSNLVLNLRLLIEHRRRPYDAVYQLSTSELFLLGRAGRLAPPIIVHPCTHAAGELRWHRAEQTYALQSEPRLVHFAVRGWLKLRSWVQPKELSRARMVIGLSRRFNQHLREDYQLPAAKLRVVSTPVDLDRFVPNGYVGARAPRTLLFISRISTRKGVEEIIELSHRLADLAGVVRILVIGGPTLWSNYTPHLERLNREVGEFVGSVSTEELPALLRSASLLLVPSRYEPGSIVTGEALACGLPVVLSDEVGNREIVSGPHVRVHRAGDADDLEQAVRSLLAAMDLDEPAIRASARANAEREFAPPTVVARLVQLLSEGAG